jgi:cytochrome c biogenesis protein CcmG/thiol:disulfide interchange protein DsbE
VAVDDPPDHEAAPAPLLSRRRLLWLGGGALVVAGLGVAGLTAGSQSGDDGAADRGDGQPDHGQAPPIELPRLAGDGDVSLSSLRGRPVVVNFFASWCVPCRKEMPAFQSAAGRLGDKVAFLGVDHQDDRKGALQLLADTGVRYPTGYDPDGRVAVAYGLFGMPTTLFVSADGRLLEKHTGELEQTISRLFGV